jgi:uncharacterized cupin superfamily protein
MKKAVHARDVPRPKIQTSYPEPFASLVAGRTKQKLGDVFGLTSFGVNLVRMEPSATSTVRHHHSHEDEFIYLLEGNLVLVTDTEETILEPGMCAGFRAGSGCAHQLQNRTERVAVFIEVGSRVPGDKVEYPYDDLAVTKTPTGLVFARKDGSPYKRDA